MSVAGRQAVVTGGARNIGLGIAGALSAAGAEVVIVDRDEKALGRAVGSLGCGAVLADMGAVAPAALADHILAEHGTVDLIVNNVGINDDLRFSESTEGEYDRVFATNLRGPWFFTQRLVEAVIAENRPASVLFISSLHSSRVRLFPSYSASKAAVTMLTKEMAHELAPHGIRVNALSPGWIGEGPHQTDTIVPLGRRGSPEDVAPMALALLDDAVSGYVTGADLVVDGGLALHSWLDDIG